MRTPELIVAHTNTDFDAFAAMVAVRKLYPGAWIALGGAVNRNVREFQALYADLVPVVDPADVERESVRRLILVDTAHPNRIGDLADLCTSPNVQLVVFDHHTPPSELPACVPREALVTSGDGALVTLLVHILASRRIPITPFEATVFALGIHEDTGSLTFATTTARDAQAFALCMDMGADMTLIERWITDVLSEEQRRTLAAALEAAETLPLPDAEVLMVVLRREAYVEGVSVVAHRMMDLTGCDACFLLVEMEHRVFVTARSRGGRVDVARVLGGIGGGGHRSAASAVVKDRTLEDTAAAIAAAVPAAVTPVRRAADVLTPSVPLVEATLTVDEAAIRCREEGLDGLVIADGELLVGRVALADLERASAHGLGHAPVKAVMTAHLSVVPADASLDRVAEAIVRDEVGWALVTARPGANGIARADVLGTIAREAVAVRPAAEAEPLSQTAANLAGRLGELGLDDLLRHIQAASAAVRGVFLVGGAVRDLLLGEPGFDIDLAVEGDGIAFAEDLAQRLKGRVRAHRKFGTAVVVYENATGGEQRVDVVSTRRESYAYPAALPSVEHAGIRSDLARRDFTLNALAVSLTPGSYGDLLDFFGGITDLERRQIVVLHNLSFIEDPTRVLRAIRYENRYGLRMDERTLNLARACCAMDLVGDLSSARLREELVALLSERRVGFSLQRMEELGLAGSLHPRASVGPSVREAVQVTDALREAHGLESEVPLWRLRVVWLLGDLEPEEIAAWTARMRIRRVDAEVLERARVVADRLLEKLRRGPSEAELYDFAHPEPAEALLVAMALDEGGASAARLAHYLDTTRHVRLEISGRDLLDLGFSPSPHLGEVLHSILALTLNGVVSTRQEQLAAAADLLSVA